MLAIAAMLAMTPAIDIPPTSVRQALAILSKRYDKYLGVETRLAGEIVVIRMQNGGEQAVREGLARVLHAQWLPDHGGFKLVRPEAEQKRLEQALADSNAVAIQKILDKVKSQLGDAKSPTERAGELVAAIKKQNDYVKEMRDAGKPSGISLDVPRMAGPAGRLLNGLIVLIGAKELSTMDFREPRIYSNEPTAAEHALPPGSADLIREYVETEGQLQGYFQDGKLNIGTDPGPYADAFDSARMPGGVGKVLISVRGGRILGYGINVYTREGKQRAYAYGNSSYVIASDAERTAGLGVKPIKIPLSKLAAEMYAVSPEHPEYGGYDEWPMTTPHKEFTPELWSAIMNPDKVDPLTLFVGDAVDAVADSKGEDLIGCLPDNLYLAGRACQSKGTLDVARFEAICRPVGGTVVEHAGGVTYFSPVWPTSTETFRLPRVALTNVLKAYKAAGKEGLDDTARFHYEADWAVMGYPARIYVRLLHYAGVQQMRESESHSHQFYAFLGSLDDEQRRRVRSGGAIQFSQLSPDQRRMADRWARQGGSDHIGGQPDYMVFATEAMPNGPPSAMVFTCDRENVPTITIDRGKNKSQFIEQPFGIEEWGRMLADVSKLNKRDLRSMYTDNNYTVGKQLRETYNLTLGDIGWETELFKQDDPTRGEPTPYTQLPKEMRDRIDQAYDEAMKKPG